MLSNLKKDFMSITDFFGKLKTITDELAITGNPISSLDFITHLISRLGQPYYLVVVYIEANLAKMTINEAYSMLLTPEARLEPNQLSASKQTKLNCAANIAQIGPNFKIRGQYNNNWKKNVGNNNGSRGGYNNGRGFSPQNQWRGNWSGTWNGVQSGNYLRRNGYNAGNDNFGNGYGHGHFNFCKVVALIVANKGGQMTRPDPI